MKVEKILWAQSARFAALALGSIYVRDAVRELQNRYGFIQVPTTASELLPDDAGAMIFRHGKVVRAGGEVVVIRELQIYRQAIVVQTMLTTDEADLVVDDVVNFAREREWVTGVGSARLYLSQLEIRLDTSLDAALGPSRHIGGQIAQLLSVYQPGARILPFRVIGMAMLPDPSVTPLHADFRIERREGVSYNDNLHFSQAPLRTSDHIAMLEAFDQASMAALKNPSTS